ncbi:hypothetical protein J6590_066413 [Homalodisca vitripennis]|nr:hypothetical protein J6590_066413 [Homalodisca vitripennis]
MCERSSTERLYFGRDSKDNWRHRLMRPDLAWGDPGVAVIKSNVLRTSFTFDSEIKKGALLKMEVSLTMARASS